MSRTMMRLVLVALACIAARSVARADDAFPNGEQTFNKAREVMRKQYFDGRFDDERAWRAATAGLFAAGGKWDKLLSPSDLAALKADLAGEVVGIGVLISFDAQASIVNVDGIVPNSSAERAGLQVGDKILKLDGRSLKGIGSEHDIARSIRGKAGTSVTLTILRDAAIITKTLKRAAFTLDPVATTTLPGGIGLVQLHAFTEKTPGMLKAALEKLRGAGVRALIVDERNNEGGLYERMLDCAGELLPKGAAIVTEVRRGGATEEKHTSTDPVLSAPIVVLVDGGTSSSAELLAGALKHAGARLVGKRTSGKWNAQRIEDLGNGWAAKLTTMMFKTPWGALPDGKGLEPDVEVEMDPREVMHAHGIKDAEKRIASDAQLRVAVNLLKLSK